MSQKISIFSILLRGLIKVCPKCGKGKIFSGYLSVNTKCSNCDEKLSIYRTDDFGPWLSIVLGGHIIVPLVLAVEQTIAPALWIQAVLWIPLTLMTVLILLPISKSICLAIMWNLKMKNQ
jgi:uncharacterized protein (DUF983 family)|tara:strand:+ start:475 stop:834 length:360 start_codon:yes stop_codon:yes gene_type:complete